MKLDVAISIDSKKVSVKSETALFAETALPLMAFSKDVGKDFEVCEAVGEDWTPERMEAAGHYPKGSKIFRVTNPFLPQYFEAPAAALMIDFYCRKTFYTIKPSRGNWRLLFGIDSFDLKITIENYLLVTIAEKSEFEKLIAQRTTRNFVING